MQLIKKFSICFFISIFLPVSFLVADSLFWNHWSDGNAEVSEYQLSFPRYGKINQGKNTLIFVTEDFLKNSQVKADRSNGSNYKVVKFNNIRNFNTGHYDYNSQTSAFNIIDFKKKNYSTVKISLNLFEWCGNTFIQLNKKNNFYEYNRYSYFENYTDNKKSIPYSSNLIIHEDSIFFHVRELLRELNFKNNNKLINLKILTSTFYNALNGAEPKILAADIEIVNQELFKLFKIDFGIRKYQIKVEKAYPRKILSWKIIHNSKKINGIEEGKLINSRRMAYW